MLWGITSLEKVISRLRSPYNFRQRLSKHNQEQGVNLLERVFEDICDQQIQTLQVRTRQ